MTHLTRQGTKHARRVLFKRDPHCHWCGQLTFEPHVCGDGHPLMATLDHVKSRLQCTAKAEYRSANNKVLACSKCNAERDRKFWIDEKPWQKPHYGRTVTIAVPRELSDALDAAVGT